MRSTDRYHPLCGKDVALFYYRRRSFAYCRLVDIFLPFSRVHGISGMRIFLCKNTAALDGSGPI